MALLWCLDEKDLMKYRSFNGSSEVNGGELLCLVENIFTTFAMLCCTRLRSLLLHAELPSTGLALRKISQAVSHASISTWTDIQGSLQLK